MWVGPWRKRFWRCERVTEDGRQCWKAPAHAGPHLVLPRDRRAGDTSVKRILDARKEVDAAVLGPAILLEALKLEQ